MAQATLTSEPINSLTCCKYGQNCLTDRANMAMTGARGKDRGPTAHQAQFLRQTLKMARGDRDGVCGALRVFASRCTPERRTFNLPSFASTTQGVRQNARKLYKTQRKKGFRSQHGAHEKWPTQIKIGLPGKTFETKETFQDKFLFHSAKA